MDLGENVNTPTTRLLTLLNVSALKSRKRTRDEDSPAPEKLNKRKTVKLVEDVTLDPGPSMLCDRTNNGTNDEVLGGNEENDDVDPQDITSAYEQHYGPNTELVSDASRSSVDQRRWTSSREKVGKLTTVFSLRNEDNTPPSKKLAKKTAISERLRGPFQARQSKQSSDQKQIQDNLLSILSAHLDLYNPALSLEDHRSVRDVVALHALDHVTKKRRRVLKNNERLAHAKAASVSPPEDVQDQGFTRPSVLVLLPFRSSALAWLDALTAHTPSPAYQIENHSRFLSEYALPPDAVDKLAVAEPGTYPRDHVETFKGNVDDNFRLGIKLTRKSVKLFADFYGCDIIFASPLGLRMSIEKEKSADFLSSIEILVIDQMNALTMQNWEHVQYVLSNMNNLPKDSHDADFSRIKPWYLDGHSAYLRQSILLSPFEMPELRALFNTTLKNAAGKVRIEKVWPAIQVPESIDQMFVSFDCANPKDEPEKRFAYFTTQLLPKVLKSAVQSANTVIFIPSSFDFIRVHNHFRKQSSLSFTVLSEYSTNQDISRARETFFSGKKAFLLVSERFHFYRRYKIRGIRNLIFYGPPEHPQFFSEFLSFPFLDDGVEASDVMSKVIYSKYDKFRLERIVGTKGLKGLVEGLL
ncbi:digestive organ expansion factor [Suillus hirtellus]|nr:digestive organ expansion factor [Suillus hirtellus]